MVKRYRLAQCGMRIMAVDAFQLDGLTVNGEYAVIDLHLLEAHTKTQHLLAGMQIQRVQVRLFRIP
ncbi:hypothetical protein D3C71_1826150 [compost metagenome]